MQLKEASITFEEKIQTIISAADAKKAADIQALDLSLIEGVITEAFVICSGASERQVDAIAANIRFEMKNSGVLPNHIEGSKLSRWVLLDYGDIVVHVFLDITREQYRLEKLWHSAPVIYPQSKLSS